MPQFLTRVTLLLFILMIYRTASFAAYISRAELVDFNFSNAVICEKKPLRLKFDFENFNTNNIFTAEIAPNGNFTPANTITLTGSVTQGGSQQNYFLTVNFPASVQPNTDYRLRVRGSSPVTVANDLNSFSFRVSKFFAADQNFYPQGFWRGYFYTWTPSIPGTINNANNEDIFNPNNYAGYISEDSLSFDYNWGNSNPAPANLPDSNKVCGSYIDYFSVRMRRRINFEAGYYLIGGGADDGFRLSLDGGVTWLINDWNDHAYRGSMQNNACGVLLSAGVRDVVAEFYENRTDARFRLILKRTGDPLVTPQITFPANGATICTSQGLIQMTANPPGALQWSGPGVAANGVLNPAVGGTGPRTIIYQTGINAFGQNCEKTTSITVNIIPGLSAQFSGLNPEYCLNAASPATLIPQNPGGIFSGPGVTGNQFYPMLAGIGTHTIRHILNSPGGCSDTVLKPVTVVAPVAVSIVNLPSDICSGTPAFVLSGIPAGGVFSGPGVSGNTFNPALAQSGVNMLNYTVVNGPCTISTQAFVNVGQNGNTSISAAQNSFCHLAGQKVKLNLFPPNGVFITSPGVQGDSLNPNLLPPGQYTISYAAGTGSCLDTGTFTVSIAPLPDAGFNDLPDTLCESAASLILVPNLPGGTFSGPGVVQPNGFSPALVQANNSYTIRHTLLLNTCSNQSEQSVYIRKKAKRLLSIGNIKSLYCSSDAAFVPTTNIPAVIYINGNPVSAVNPAALGPGNFALRAVYIPDDTEPLCTDSSSVLIPFAVIANPKPELGPSFETEKGTQITLDPKVSPPYEWQLLPASNGSGANDNILIFNPEESGTIRITAYDPSRTCTGTDEVSFEVLPPLAFPNLITLNGDNKNDFWQISGARKPMKVSIFDRWGKEIYSGMTDGEKAWDGAEARESGVYFYLMERVDNPQKWRGWVLVEK
jgi:gliding motility-associated-like protein